MPQVAVLEHFLPEDSVVGIEVVVVGQDLECLLRVDHEDCLLVEPLEDEPLNEVTAEGVLVVFLVFGDLDLEELCVDVFVDGVDGDRGEDALLEFDLPVRAGREEDGVDDVVGDAVGGVLHAQRD